MPAYAHYALQIYPAPSTPTYGAHRSAPCLWLGCGVGRGGVGRWGRGSSLPFLLLESILLIILLPVVFPLLIVKKSTHIRLVALPTPSLYYLFPRHNVVRK